MYHDVHPAAVIMVQLDEVIAASQCAGSLVQPLAVLQVAEAAQGLDQFPGFPVPFHIRLGQHQFRLVPDAPA